MTDNTQKAQCGHNSRYDEPNGWTVCSICGANIERWASKSAQKAQGSGAGALRKFIKAYDVSGGNKSGAMHDAYLEAKAALSQPPEASEVEADPDICAGCAEYYHDCRCPGNLCAAPPKASPMQEDEGFDDRGDWLEKSIERINDMDPGFSPPKVEASALREAQAIAGDMSHRDDCTGSPDYPNVCGCGLTQLRLALAHPAPEQGEG